MSTNESTSSRGTQSRSRSRSRSPSYTNGRYPSRYSSRYESYSYRPRSGMTAAIDDYWELRDRERERERDRSMMIREDRYGRGWDTRHMPHYRDDPPPSHYYGPPHAQRDYGKPPPLSSSTSLRRENSTERTPSQSKDDSGINNSGNKPIATTPTFDSYSARYSDWREREWDRDRRYRDEDRRREFDRRNRDRDGYMIRDARLDSQAYVGGSSISGYPPPPFGRDSYRPGGREPSSPGTHSYYDRDLYRSLSSRGSSIDLDQYRNSRIPHLVAENSTSSISGTGNNDRWRASSHDRERISSGKYMLGVTGPTSSSTSSPKDDGKSTDMKFNQNIDTGDQYSGHVISEDAEKPDESYTDVTTKQSGTLLAANDGDEYQSTDVDLMGNVERYDDHSRESQHRNLTTKPNTLRIDVSLPIKSLHNEDAPKTPSSSSSTLSSRSTAAVVIPPSTANVSAHSPESNTIPLKSNTPSTSSIPLAKIKKETTPVSAKACDRLKSVPILSSSTKATTKINIEPNISPSVVSALKLTKPKSLNSSIPSSMNDVKENLEPNVNNQVKPESVMSQQQIVARIDEIENSITKYEEMLAQLSRREAHAKDLEQQKENSQQQSEVSPSPKTDNDDNDTEEETARKAAHQAIGVNNQPLSDIQNNFSNDTSMMRKRPQLLIGQMRTAGDPMDNSLVDMIISTNQKLAKGNSNLVGGWQGKATKEDDWYDERKWTAPLYDKLQDYPCYKENMAAFEKNKGTMTLCLATRHKHLKQKERQLKRQFKEIYGQWKDKNIALDRARIQQRRKQDRSGASGGVVFRPSTRRTRGVEDVSEEYTDGVIFTGNHDTLRFGTDGATTAFGHPNGEGGWTSDAARSEAELMEIIQSLESAEMRNPELRAAKTTATIPPMILDIKVRSQTYDDRSGLVENPLAYYHTGTETEDVWTQHEMTSFMESYMRYPKQFDKIAVAVGTKSASQCVQFYYRKKTKIDFKALMRKGKRGKSRKRERLAAAIKRATGDTATNTRSGKNKGSALMADIGKAQVSRKAKEKESETKSKELRELEQANAYWDGVAERRKAKRSTYNPGSTSRTNTANDDSISTTTTEYAMKRKLGKRKLRSPRLSAASIPGSDVITPETLMDEATFGATTTAASLNPSKQQHVVQQMEAPHSHGHHDSSVDDGVDQNEPNSVNAATAKWTDHDKHAAIEAFKVFGRDFGKASEMVGNKTDDQCRNFYFNHKRKFGSNAFGEEAGGPLETHGAMFPTTSTSSPKINAVIPSFDIASAAKSERPDLKAEEEDAAAALVGLCQMGGSRDHFIGAAPSPLLYSPSVSYLPGEMTPQLPSKQSTTSFQTQQPKGRQRATITSGKMDDQWIGDDYGMTVPGSSTTIGKRVTPDIKRGSNSSYWSVSERNEFIQYLERHGRDWTKIANAMKTKTMIQVRNFYQNNQGKLQLDKVIHRREGIIPVSTAFQGSPHYSNTNNNKLEITQQQIMPPMGTSFDNHILSNSPSSMRLQASPTPHLSSPQPSNYNAPQPTLPQHLPYGKHAEPTSYHPASSTSRPKAGCFDSSSPSSPSIPRFTHSAPRDYSLYGNTNVSSYPTNYDTNGITLGYTADPSQHHHRPPSLLTRYNARHMPLGTSTTGVTKVSDLLNSNDEPAETNNQKSWETWFGS